MGKLPYWKHPWYVYKLACNWVACNCINGGSWQYLNDLDLSLILVDSFWQKQIPFIAMQLTNQFTKNKAQLTAAKYRMHR